MSKIKQNFFYNVMYQLLLIILPLITAPYIARVVGAEGIGVYAYTYSIVYYFSLFILLGLNNYGNRSIAVIRDDTKLLTKVFWEIFSMQSIMGIVVIILYITFVFGFSKKEYLQIQLIQGIYLLSACLDINWFYFGIEKFKLTVVRNSIIKILTVVCIFLFVKKIDDLDLYICILAGGTLLSTLVLWTFLCQHIQGYIIPKAKDIKQHIIPNLTLFIPVLAVSLYKVMDKIMLGSMSTMVETGYYENAEKIVNIPTGVITALGIVMLPRMSYLVSKKDFSTSLKYIEISLELVIFLACALCFGIAGISPVFTPLYFGENFQKCSSLISSMSIIIIFLSWANVIRTQYLIPNCRDKEYIVSVIIGAFLNMIINVCLIPRHGAMGAVAGTIVAEIAVAVYQTWIVRKELPILSCLKNSMFFIGIGGLMFIGLRILAICMKHSLISLIIMIVIGSAFYLLLSGLYFYRKKNQVFMLYIARIINLIKNVI